MNTKPPLLVIAGPTASGKSSLALALSRHVPVTIINADASQVYADLRIVTARPSPEEEAQAPHLLFGHIDGSENCTAARWAAEARAAINATHAEGRLPVLVGGTGLYIRTLLEGLAPVPEIDPAIRTEVRTLPTSEAYQRLTLEDPEAAARLNPRDTTRIARALEVKLSSGQSLADWQRQKVGGIGYDMAVSGLILLPPREWLRERCDARFDAMMAAGAEDEVRTLLARNLPPSLPVMRAIGVREIAALIADPDCRPEAIKQASAATRQYAKRQYTWFRNQSPACWLRHNSQLDGDSINEMVIKLRKMLLTR